MKDYIILFLLVLTSLHGIKCIKHGFLISNSENYIKKIQEKLDHANKTKDRKGLICLAILICWSIGIFIISLSIYAISTIIKVG